MRHLTWVQIVRLGLVQMALGSIVVLTTSTLNRLMVVEYGLAAVLPGALVSLHYGIQISRPHWGFASDRGGHRTRWIIGGMAALGAGAMLAALALPLFDGMFVAGLALSIVAYALIGLGAGASGTSLLALLATATDERRRAAAATITWLMMIFGIAATAGTVGALMEPYSLPLLWRIVALVTVTAVIVTALAVRGIEARVGRIPAPEAPVPFREGLAEIWAEPAARAFTIFVFLSMTAYFMQELILEPYAGLVFHLTPGQSTSLSGAQNGGVFLGMVIVGVAATGLRFGALRSWVIAGCLGSAVALAVLAGIGPGGDAGLLMPSVVGLGVFNGMFAVAAIGSMMQLAGQGRDRREGTRMGLWGAAQAVAAGFGGLLGAGAVDVLRHSLPDAQAFGAVFLAEAALFLVAAALAARVIRGRDAPVPTLVPGE